jgi:hypothetical protein
VAIYHARERCCARPARRSPCEMRCCPRRPSGCPPSFKRSTPSWTMSASSPRGGRCSRRGWGRPSIPIDMGLWLLYLKHRDQLGYERLYREVSAWISWCCHLPLDRPRAASDHPGQAGGSRRPETIEQLNQALLAKLVQGKLLRARKLPIDTTDPPSPSRDRYEPRHKIKTLRRHEPGRCCGTQPRPVTCL